MFFYDAMLLSLHTYPFVHQGCACKRNFHFLLSLTEKKELLVTREKVLVAISRTIPVCTDKFIKFSTLTGSQQPLFMTFIAYRYMYTTLYRWKFFPNTARSHWLLRGHMTSNNLFYAGNIRDLSIRQRRRP